MPMERDASLAAHGAPAPASAPLRWGGLGIPVDVVDPEGALRWVEARIAGGGGGWVCTPNPEMAVSAWGSHAIMETMRLATLSVPDGVGMLWGSKILGGPLQARVPGIELLERCLELCAGRGWPVYFLGSKPGVAAEAAERAVARWPGLSIAGTHHGYFSDADAPAVAAAVAASQPKLLAVGLGHPKQEEWLAKYCPGMPGVVGFACGGSLDILAGRVQRAPAWARSTGLEWLFRIVSQPRKRIGRSRALPRFAVRVIAMRLGLARRFA